MKLIFALLFLSFSLLWANEIKRGFPISVNLVSGTSQKAEYMGSSKDTIYLGGFVADTFTVVKILKSRISSLRDSSGNALSFKNADSLLYVQTISGNVIKSAKNLSTDSSFAATSRADSILNEKNDSAKTETDTNSSATGIPDTVSQIDISGKSLIFNAIRRPIDSALAVRILDLQMQTLKEQGDRPLFVTTEDFPNCNDSPCIAKDADAKGATSIWTLEIQPAKHQDSLDLFLHYFLFKDQSLHTQKLTLSAKSATNELLSKDRFLNWIQKAKGMYKEVKKEQPNKSFIYVVTDPEEANLSRVGGEVICQTPCAFAVNDTGKVELEAYWDVENTLWANRAIIRPIPGDTAKVNLLLKRVKPEVEVRTIPAGAQIFEAAEVTPHSRPIGKTPKTLFTEEPGPAELHLWREGYRDTIIQFHVSATRKTSIEIKLDSLTDPLALQDQEVFRNIQKRIFWGNVAIGVSIAPAVAGAILLYLADKDHDKASDIKSELELPSSGYGENFERLIDQNHHYADRSKTERRLGVGTLLLAGALLSAGIILSF